MSRRDAARAPGGCRRRSLHLEASSAPSAATSGSRVGGRALGGRQKVTSSASDSPAGRSTAPSPSWVNARSLGASACTKRAPSPRFAQTSARQRAEPTSAPPNYDGRRRADERGRHAHAAEHEARVAALGGEEELRLTGPASTGPKTSCTGARPPSPMESSGVPELNRSPAERRATATAAVRAHAAHRGRRAARPRSGCRHPACRPADPSTRRRRAARSPARPAASGRRRTRRRSRPDRAGALSARVIHSRARPSSPCSLLELGHQRRHAPASARR